MITDQSTTVACSSDLPDSSSSSKIYDVVIVGAGPIGLATAIGLRQRGIENLLVLDRTRAFRQVGQVIDLLPNGLKSLKYLDPQAYQAVKQAGYRPPNCQKFCYNKFFYVMFFIRETEWGIIEHLMIARLNGDRIPDHWATLQRIKNEVVGSDRLAIEVYPPASEVIDECNAYHLWVLPEGFQLPFGLTCSWINSSQK